MSPRTAVTLLLLTAIGVGVFHRVVGIGQPSRPTPDTAALRRFEAIDRRIASMTPEDRGATLLAEADSYFKARDKFEALLAEEKARHRARAQKTDAELAALQARLHAADEGLAESEAKYKALDKETAALSEDRSGLREAYRQLSTNSGRARATIERINDSLEAARLMNGRLRNRVPPTVTIHVRRHEADDPGKAHTRITIGNDKRTFRLPAGWRGRTRESAKRRAAYDAVITEVRAVVSKKITAYGNVPKDIKGEIVTAASEGTTVPHGDVIAMLDVLVGLGLVDVVFSRPAAPPTAKARAAPKK